MVSGYLDVTDPRYLKITDSGYLKTTDSGYFMATDSEYLKVKVTTLKSKKSRFVYF